MLSSWISLLAFSGAALSSAVPRDQPFKSALQRRQQSGNSLRVDLGYEIYEGTSNSTTGLNVWKGIRFAAAPVGDLRWQAPQPPVYNRSQVIQANAFGSECPQNVFSFGSGPSLISGGLQGSEDCLFLNVYSPSNATSLPVLVWIHGGGYGLGNGQQDMTEILNTNNNDFVAVSIQYRLGAFGFLSSDEVFRKGVVNAGILDQHFALQWVQAYISQFGGNASHVTIMGESAGGGSVMLQDMAYGGTIGDSLFTNTIAASPYLPMQYNYDGFVPSQSYYAFAIKAGCFNSDAAYGSNARSIFECLVAQNSTTLMTASANISASGTYGTWGFLPVTDGVFVQQTPSEQLLKKQVNGRNALIGNNANEGPLFTPRNISTEAALVDWLRLTFPLFTNDDIAKILLYYPSTNASDNSYPGIDFATLGYTGPTALNESNIAYGQQQRADNIYAETTFVCPSYWMAEAYTDGGRSSYKYQYSVLPALHGTDVTGYFGPAAPYQGPGFVKAFMTIVGNFVTQDNPSISNAIANGAANGSATGYNAASNWPPFAIYAPYQINLNQTGGNLTTLVNFAANGGVSTQAYLDPGLHNNFSLVNAYTWEGGRGYRCDFWRSMGPLVPE